MQPRLESKEEKKSLGQLIAFVRSIASNITNTSTVLRSAAEVFKPLEQFAVSVHDFRPDYTVPVNQSLIVMAHNAYNIVGTGVTSAMPNQQASLSELLDMGVRGFELDVYTRGKDFLLCHGLCNHDLGEHVGAGLDWLFGQNRRLVDALQEVAKFIKANPTEVIALKLEDHVGQDVTELRNTIQGIFGNQTIFTADDLARNGNKWPSFAELAEKGQQMFITTEHLGGPDPFFINTPHAKDVFSVGRYYSLYEAIKRGFSNITPEQEGQLVEIGEDGTTLGSIRARVPKYRDLLRDTGGGQFTREQIQEITASGGVGGQGAILGLDNISYSDCRFVDGLFVNLRGDCRYFIPAAVLGAAMVSGCGLLKSKSSKLDFVAAPTKLAIQLLVYSLLPASGVFLYNTVQGSIVEFSRESREQVAKSMQEANESILTKFGRYAKMVTPSVISGVGEALDFSAKIALRGAITSIRQTSSFASDNVAAETATQLVFDTYLANTIVESTKSAAKATASYIGRKLGW